MSRNARAGTWVTLALSVLLALVSALIRPVKSDATILIYLAVSLILSLIVLFVVRQLILRIYPVSRFWGYTGWIAGLCGALVLTGLILAGGAWVVTNFTGISLDVQNLLQSPASASSTDFERPDLGFATLYPDSWNYTASTIRDNPPVMQIEFSSPDEDSVVYIIVTDATDKSYYISDSLEDWTAKNLDSLRSGTILSDVTVTGTRTTSMDSWPMERIDLTATRGSGTNVQCMMYGAIKGKRGYVILYCAPLNQFNNQLLPLQTPVIVNGFRFTG